MLASSLSSPALPSVKAGSGEPGMPLFDEVWFAEVVSGRPSNVTPPNARELLESIGQPSVGLPVSVSSGSSEPGEAVFSEARVGGMETNKEGEVVETPGGGSGKDGVVLECTGGQGGLEEGVESWQQVEEKVRLG